MKLLAFFRVALTWLVMLFTADNAMADGSFYKTNADDLRGAPGTLIRYQRMYDAPIGTVAYRILYRSVGLHGETVPVSGFAVIPDVALAASNRWIVAWAHPTTGVVTACAPSLTRSKYDYVQGLAEMIRRGFAVVATDYPGLGAEGLHPYLIGDREGRAVLDSVRALRALPDAMAGHDFVVWGHSQGGQAALYTGLLAERYAPDLRLLGVAAAAPATDLGTLFADDLGTPGGKNLTAMTLWSWSRLFGASLGNVVTPQSLPTIDRLSEGCIESLWDVLERRVEERPLQNSFLEVGNLTRIPPWSTIMHDNTPGTLPHTLPVFLAQGVKDNVVRPAVTVAFARRLCDMGSRVRFLWNSKDGHAFIARDSADAAIGWMQDRFLARAAPDDCRNIAMP